MTKYMSAAVVRTSTGRAVIFDIFRAVYINSTTPTADTSALSLKRLTMLDIKLGIALMTACGATTKVDCVICERPNALQASYWSLPIDFSAERNDSLVMADVKSVSAMNDDKNGPNSTP